VVICVAVLTEYRLLTDRQTDGQTDKQKDTMSYTLLAYRRTANTEAILRHIMHNVVLARRFTTYYSPDGSTVSAVPSHQLACYGRPM